MNRLGTLARFSSLLVDYESVRRRARPDPDAPGEQLGGQDRGMWYYRNLAIHIINYAQGAYEGFDGEADFVLERGRPHHGPPGQGPGMAGGLRPVRDGQPVPDHTSWRGPALAGPA